MLLYYVYYISIDTSWNSRENEHISVVYKHFSFTLTLFFTIQQHGQKKGNMVDFTTKSAVHIFSRVFSPFSSSYGG